MNYYVDDLINRALRIEKPYCTYENVQRILIDNGIPFYVKKVIGMGGDCLSGVEIFECGINMLKKLEITRNLLDGERVDIRASGEVIIITEK